MHKINGKWTPRTLQQRGYIQFDDTDGHGGGGKSAAEIAADKRAADAEARQKEMQAELDKLKAGGGGSGDKPITEGQLQKWLELLQRPENKDALASFTKQLVGPEIEKVQARQAELERKTLVAELCSEFGVSKEQAELYMTATDPDILRKQAEGLKKQNDAGTGAAGGNSGGAGGAGKPAAAQVPVYPGPEKSGMTREEWQVAQFAESYDKGAGREQLPA